MRMRTFDLYEVEFGKTVISCFKFNVMCTNTRYITTRTKVLSSFHNERFLQPCVCGKCAECLAMKKNEWTFRIFYEWLDTLNKNGWILFDTLTYNNESLPHLSDFVPVSTSADHSCFNRSHISKFLSNLRRKVEVKTGSTTGVRYFLAAEYGSDSRYTHRPHYHVIFFVTSPISVQWFKNAVRQSWRHGFVDRLRMFGQRANYFTKDSHGIRNTLSIAHYVGKYVQKTSFFQSAIEKRINDYLSSEFDDTQYERIFVGRDYDGYAMFQLRGFEHVSNFEDTRRKLVREVQEFHTQSQGFGISALSEVDLLDLFRTGTLIMPDCEKHHRRLSLPKYYERKLFEEQIEFQGYRIWQPTRLGKLWRRRKLELSARSLLDKMTVIRDQYGINSNVDLPELVRYVTYYKGRLKGHLSEILSFEDKLKLPNLIFNYSTPTDIALFGEAYITTEFNGMQSTYYSAYLENAIPVKWWIRQNVITEADNPRWRGFDSALSAYHRKLAELGRSKNAAFELKQRLHNNAQLTLSLV